MAPFARRHLWCICAAVSVGSQCVVARFARRHLWGTCAAVSIGSVRGCSLRSKALMGYLCRGQCWVTVRSDSLRS